MFSNFVDDETVLSTNKFVSIMKNNPDEYFKTLIPGFNNISDYENRPFGIPYEIQETDFVSHKEPQDIETLWNNKFDYMVVENVKDNCKMIIFGKYGFMYRNNNGLIKGRYYQERYNHIKEGKFYVVKNQNNKEWKSYKATYLSNETLKNRSSELLENSEIRAMDDSKECRYFSNICWSNTNNKISDYNFEGDYNIYELIKKNFSHCFFARYKKNGMCFYFDEYNYKNYYDSYLLNLEQSRYCKGCVVNYLIRKEMIDEKWEQIIINKKEEDKISIVKKQEPEYEELKIRDNYSFYGEFTADELIKNNVGKKFVARCIENQETYIFVPVHRYGSNEFLFDLENKKWELLIDDPKELLLAKARDSVHKKGKLYSIYQLFSKTNKECIYVKNSITDYLYMIDYRSFKGPKQLNVRIFNEETGEEITGDKTAFCYDLIYCCIWYEVKNEYRE